MHPLESPETPGAVCDVCALCDITKGQWIRRCVLAGPLQKAKLQIKVGNGTTNGSFTNNGSGF